MRLDLLCYASQHPLCLADDICMFTTTESSKSEGILTEKLTKKNNRNTVTNQNYRSHHKTCCSRRPGKQQTNKPLAVFERIGYRKRTVCRLLITFHLRTLQLLQDDDDSCTGEVVENNKACMETGKRVAYCSGKTQEP